MSSHDGSIAPSTRPGDERTLFLLDHRMQNALQAGECAGVAKDRIAQCDPINRAVPDRARKCRLDGANRPPAARLQPMHRGIRIEHRYPRAAESGCCCRLAHANPAGQS